MSIPTQFNPLGTLGMKPLEYLDMGDRAIFIHAWEKKNLTLEESPNLAVEFDANIGVIANWNLLMKVSSSANFPSFFGLQKASAANNSFYVGVNSSTYSLDTRIVVGERSTTILGKGKLVVNGQTVFQASNPGPYDRELPAIVTFSKQVNVRIFAVKLHRTGYESLEYLPYERKGEKGLFCRQNNEFA